MNIVNVPTREQVSPENQAIFDQLEKGIGFVPNLYAVFAHSEHALAGYMTLQQAPSSLTMREREVVVLVVSQVNNCLYSLSAHTALARKVGFTDSQIMAIRHGGAPFDAKLDALAQLAHDLAIERGHVSPALVEAFFSTGYSKANLIDVMMVIGDRTITSFLFNATGIPVDFPLAPPLEA